MLKIIPLGGLGEIGLNMMVVEFGASLFVIDAGLMFPEDYMLGVDYVIPNMDYLKQNKTRVSGIILTHAHEDHIGAVPFLLKSLNAPVFGTAFTLGMLRHKLEEHGLLASAALYEIAPGEKLKIGVFELEFIRVTHSVVDGIGIAIKTPLGLIVHTGDFKISRTAVEGMETDVGRFARCGEEGVLALLSDSTNVEREGYTKSAQEIGKTLASISAESRGRIIVALFASNIGRIQQVVNIAEAMGRKIIFNGKSIEMSVNLARQLGYITIPDSLEISVDQIDHYRDDEIVMLMTGSQGEPMSALARIASGAHKQIGVKEEDTIILSSKFIPGNEKAITNIINALYKRGANVIYEVISDIHVSGHAFQEELKLMINLTRPQYLVPIHGEYRHLVLHSRLAQDMGIPKDRILLAENGQIIRFDGKMGCIQGSISTGRVLIDGKGVGDVGRSVLRERRTLSEEGLVVVNMAFDEETGIILYGPEIVSRGFVFGTETGHLLEDAKCVVLEIVEEVGPENRNRVNLVQTRVQSALKKYFYFAIGRRPVILPFIVEL